MSDSFGPKTIPPVSGEDVCKTNKNAIDLTRALATGVFKTDEAAYYLAISRQTLWNWKLEGRIKAMTLAKGRTLRFHINELKKILGE